MGLSLTAARDTGTWDKDAKWRDFPSSYQQDEGRAELWGIVRAHDKLQVFGRLPWVQGLRRADGVGRMTAGGLGDVQLGARWDFVLPGDESGWPAVALTWTLAAPTSTRAEDADDALGAGATGRGVWSSGVALGVEKVWLPWFVRLDAGLSASAPFLRSDVQLRQRFGPVAQLAVAGGREVIAETLTVAAQLLIDREWPYVLNDTTQTQSGGSGLTASVSAAWRVDWRWTVTAALTSDGLDGLVGARNRTERWAATVGLRHAWND